MCNGSKSHNPFSINNCNGVTGVPHLTWVPPMTRMGGSSGGFVFILPAHPCHPWHPWHPWSTGRKPPLCQEWLRDIRHTWQRPGSAAAPARGQNQAEKALLVLATSGGAAAGGGKGRGKVRAPVAPQAPLCGASRGRALRTTPLCRGAVSSCDNGAAWTGTRRGGQISFGLTHGEH